jgi:hypothetical protein
MLIRALVRQFSIPMCDKNDLSFSEAVGVLKPVKLFAALLFGGFMMLAPAFMAPHSAQAVAKPSGAFEPLEGTWRGTGKIMLSSGQMQRIRCRAYYRVLNGGSELGLAIRCAATDNRIELRANVTDSHGRLQGAWEERTFNATGKITGRAQPGKMSLSIAGAVQGSMNISFSAGQQSVNISTAAEGLRGISINLRR